MRAIKSMIDVERRWTELCTSIAAVPETTRAVWLDIAAAYGAHGRYYHTLSHIAALLELSERDASAIADRRAFDFAIILHDVVYEPRGGDNEEASAAWARNRLSRLGADAELIDAVEVLIEMSRHRAEEVAEVEPESDLARFLDFDLSVLAAPPPVYAAYAAAIRKEYGLFPDLLYNPGRARVLRGFLQRPHLYCSTSARAAWEAAARQNLASEIRSLTGS